MSDKSKLKLVADSWYAWQMIPGYGTERCVPYCSPIYQGFTLNYQDGLRAGGDADS
jgi:hypothetical protein